MKRRWGFFAAGAMLAAGIVYLLFASEKARRVARKVIQGAGILLARLHEQGPTVVILWIRDHLLRRIQGMSPADTSCVAQRLYVGGQHARHGLGRLAALNITASVSLRQEFGRYRARGGAGAAPLVTYGGRHPTRAGATGPGGRVCSPGDPGWAGCVCALCFRHWPGAYHGRCLPGKHRHDPGRGLGSNPAPPAVYPAEGGPGGTA